MIAPSAGAALLALGGWRVIHAVLAGIGVLLLLAMLLGFAESARLDPANRLVPSVIVRNYLSVLTHPLCLGYILINAAAFGALFAYVSGSSLFLINVVGLRPGQFGLVFNLARDHGGCLPQRPAQRLGRPAVLSVDDRPGAGGGHRNRPCC